MKIKLIISLLIISMQILTVSASVKPVIVTNMPNPINSGLQTLDLHWTIIDDNPRDYVLSINNKTWKNDSLLSNEINVPFSNPYGWYNITLQVTDYSGNVVYSNLYINMSPVFPVSQSSITSTSGTSYNYTQSKATPGFEYLAVILMLPLLSTYSLRKRRKSKKFNI